MRRQLLVMHLLLLPNFCFGGEHSENMKSEMSKCRELSNYERLAGCFALVHEKSDSLLNQVYKELINYLKEKDRVNLVDAQRKWISFRDADCKFSDPREKNSPIPKANEAACLAENTISRLAQLEDYNAYYNKGCNGCPW